MQPADVITVMRAVEDLPVILREGRSATKPSWRHAGAAGGYSDGGCCEFFPQEGVLARPSVAGPPRGRTGPRRSARADEQRQADDSVHHGHHCRDDRAAPVLKTSTTETPTEIGEGSISSSR